MLWSVSKVLVFICSIIIHPHEHIVVAEGLTHYPAQNPRFARHDLWGGVYFPQDFGIDNIRNVAMWGVLVILFVALDKVKYN